jgi:sulfide:quinone oxidoreductase
MPESRIDIGRRAAVARLAALAAAGGVGLTARAATARVSTSARIVIAGAGAAGLAAASQLAARLQGAKIIVIDARQEHFYQPGYTLVAAGIKPRDYVISRTAEYLPRGLEWIQEAVAEIDPDGNKVVTSGGRSVAYDFLIVATGLELAYDLIEGMDVARIGKDGLGSVYHSPQGAEATWQALAAFVQQGGVGLFGRPATEMKCAGAPVKYAFITDDRLRRAGSRGKAELHFMAHNRTLFGVPIVSEKVRMLYRDRDVKVHYEHVLQSIDPGRRIATYRTPGGTVQHRYDFINVVPPMRAPRVVRESPLRWQQGPWAEQGWVHVDKATLRHVRYATMALKPTYVAMLRGRA